MATARESAVVSETDEEGEEDEEGHDFNVGDSVNILQDQKMERVNQIARVLAINPKVTTTIKYSGWDRWDHETSEDKEWPPGRCSECRGYGPMGNRCMSSECEDSGMMYDSSGSCKY
eukprot:scaffold19497_cov58-Attheya_sp.AAC.1